MLLGLVRQAALDHLKPRQQTKTQTNKEATQHKLENKNESYISSQLVLEHSSVP